MGCTTGVGDPASYNIQTAIIAPVPNFVKFPVLMFGESPELTLVYTDFQVRTRKKFHQEDHEFHITENFGMHR